MLLYLMRMKLLKNIKGNKMIVWVLYMLAVNHQTNITFDIAIFNSAEKCIEMSVQAQKKYSNKYGTKDNPMTSY